MRQYARFELLTLLLVQLGLVFPVFTSLEHETRFPGIYSQLQLYNSPGNIQEARPVLVVERDELSQEDKMHRRDFIKLAGVGGVVFASGLGVKVLGAGSASEGRTSPDEFYFVQFSDTHWGFDGPSINPDSQGTLKKAVAAVNTLEEQPDFVVFTGDLTHITEDKQARRDRLAQFRDIAGTLKAKTVRFMAGEHDASLDRGDAYKEFFGKLNYSFDHKGVHFVVVDNVSDPSALVGEAQLKWLQSDLSRLKKDAPIVVLTHRPLFDLYPQWDWTTRDGTAVINALMPYKNVTVFYGHIHQEHH